LIPKKSNIKPQVIINITNDNWFGKTPGTYQHLDMVRRYAIESGLPIIRANYSGISAFIRSDGNIESYLPIGASGYLDGYISENHETIYRKIGRDRFMIIILMFSIICSISISVFQKKD
jgi:apolipoprotein N-acyltransferase